jgi:hypothetical protein
VKRAEVLISIGIAIGSGVIVALLWASLEWCRRWNRNRKYFRQREGLYTITRKLAKKPQPHRASIKVDGNILKVDLVNLPTGDWARGEIFMNASFPRSGNGSYSHHKGGKQLGGSWDLHVIDRNRLFVTTTYAHHERFVPVIEAEVWDRIAPPDTDPKAPSLLDRVRKNVFRIGR